MSGSTLRMLKRDADHLPRRGTSNFRVDEQSIGAEPAFASNRQAKKVHHR